MIQIEKLNEVYIRIFSDDFGIEQELSEFFQFEVPGYRFMPAYKAGLFDGKIRLYNLQRKTLYVGLLPYVLFYAKENNYPVEFLNEISVEQEIDDKILEKFFIWLNLHGKGNPIEIRDYQKDAVKQGLSKGRTILVSPTASGKSLIIYSMVRWHLENNLKCIIIVPTTALVEQLYSDFEDYSSANGWSTEKHCQKLYSGFSKDFNKDVLFTTWQSIYKQPKSWFDQFNVVIGDEAHTFKATSLTSIMEKMTDVKYRIGTTGTLDDSKVNKLVLEGCFGPVYKVITTKQLMDNNSVVNLKIKAVILNYDEEIRKMMKKTSYQEELEFIVTNIKRNKFITNLTVSCKGNTLVLFQFVEKHGHVLYDMIQQKAGDRSVYYIHGGTDVSDRENVRSILEKETDSIIIASVGVFSTGINIPSIQNIIFATPSKSKIRNLQSIGRGLRNNKDKTHCKLFDIADNLSYKSHKNFTLQHAEIRYKLYMEEQFEMQLIEYNL